MVRIMPWFLRSARRGPMSCVIGAAVFVFGAGSASADSESSPVSSDPVFKALMVDGRSPSGRLISFGPDAITIATPEGKKEKLPLDRLVKLTREPVPMVSAWEESQAVLLPDGDRLMRTAIGSANDTSLEVRSESLGKLDFRWIASWVDPLDTGSVRHVRCTLGPDPGRTAQERGGLADQRRPARRQLPRDGRPEDQG